MLSRRDPSTASTAKNWISERVRVAAIYPFRARNLEVPRWYGTFDRRRTAGAREEAFCPRRVPTFQAKPGKSVSISGAPRFERDTGARHVGGK